MGLYLTVFRDEDELEGVEIGSYADFNFFRDQVVGKLEGGKPGTRFPRLILHSDCDGVWTPAECLELEQELRTIQAELRDLPPVPLPRDWQADVARSLGLRAINLDECFFDVDGEPLTDRLIGLARIAQDSGEEVLFQ